MSDVDVLVRKEDIGRVQDVMRNLGFTQSSPAHEAYGQVSFKHSEMGLFEAHWLPTYKGGLSIDTEGLWERSRETRVAGVPVRELSPEDQVLQLCIHAAGHYFSFGLRALCDISESLRYHQGVLDWECLGQRASSWGVARVLLVNLWLARELLNSPGVDRWPNSRHPDHAALPYLNRARDSIFDTARARGRSYSRFLSWIAAERSVRGKVRLVWRGASRFVSKELVADRYFTTPDSTRIYLYYPIHFAYLLPRLLRGIWYFSTANGSAAALTRFEVNARMLREWMWSRD